MNIEQEYMVRILGDFIKMKKTEPADVDWGKLYLIAQQQQISAIIYAQTKNILFERAYLYQLTRAMHLDYQWNQLRLLLDGMEYCLMKGARLKECYPAHNLRSMGDVDVLIHSEDRQKVHQLLTDQGFTFVIAGSDQWLYNKSGINYEFHDRLTLDYKKNTSCDAFASRVWEYVEGNKLDWSYHFIYILFHLRKHLINYGVGLRQFMDIAVLCELRKDLDWQWIIQQLEKLEAIKFAGQVLAFNQRTFGVTAPIDVDEMDEEFYQIVLDKIFKDGVFGYNNLDNRYNKITMIMRKQGTNEAKAKKKFLLQTAFPSYDQIHRYEYLNYLDGRKYLLPIAWVHRAIYRLCNKEKREDMIEAFQMNKDKIQKRNDILKKWGI